MRSTLAAVAAVALLLAACGAGSSGGEIDDSVTPFAQIASANGSIGVGEQRVLVAIIDRDTNAFLASPDRPATVTVADENGAPLDTYETSFVWAVEDSRGLYVANMTFDEPGTYQVTIEAEGLAPAGPTGLEVFEDPLVVQKGQPAPPSVTRTAAEYPDLSLISSDPDPDPAMYEISVDEAVTNGTPSVIVFATPAWCVSETCGPLLEQVKALRPEYEGVDFVHVEIYSDIQVDSFEELATVPAVEEWGLPSEPWVFVVDASGVVSASFEGVAGDDELAGAIDAVAS